MPYHAVIVATVLVVTAAIVYYYTKKETKPSPSPTPAPTPTPAPPSCPSIPHCKTVRADCTCETCEDTYHGKQCDQVCGPNSTWDDKQSVCVCSAGYKGVPPNCVPDHCVKKAVRNCVTYNDATCVCAVCVQPYHGDDCTQSCGANERYNAKTASCECVDGYTGYPDCQKPTPPDCKKIFHCDIYDADDCTICQKCNAPYHGPQCDQICGDHQQWNGKACACIDGYTGYPNCAPKPIPGQVCNEHQVLDSKTNTCVCKCCHPDRSPLYVGPNCEFSNEVTCNSNGKANADGSCTCSSYTSRVDGAARVYLGVHCQYSDNDTCGGKGIVNANGECSDVLPALSFMTWWVAGKPLPSGNWMYTSMQSWVMNKTPEINLPYGFMGLWDYSKRPTTPAGWEKSFHITGDLYQVKKVSDAIHLPAGIMLFTTGAAPAGWTQLNWSQQDMRHPKEGHPIIKND